MMKRREFLTSTAGVLGLLQTLKANQEKIKKKWQIRYSTMDGRRAIYCGYLGSKT